MCVFEMLKLKEVYIFKLVSIIKLEFNSLPGRHHMQKFIRHMSFLSSLFLRLFKEVGVCYWISDVDRGARECSSPAPFFESAMETKYS